MNKRTAHFATLLGLALTGWAAVCLAAMFLGKPEDFAAFWVGTMFLLSWLLGQFCCWLGYVRAQGGLLPTIGYVCALAMTLTVIGLLAAAFRP